MKPRFQNRKSKASLRTLGLLSQGSEYPEVLTVALQPPDTACDGLPSVMGIPPSPCQFKNNSDRARIGPEELGEV